MDERLDELSTDHPAHRALLDIRMQHTVGRFADSLYDKAVAGEPGPGSDLFASYRKLVERSSKRVQELYEVIQDLSNEQVERLFEKLCIPCASLWLKNLLQTITCWCLLFS